MAKILVKILRCLATTVVVWVLPICEVRSSSISNRNMEKTIQNSVQFTDTPHINSNNNNNAAQSNNSTEVIENPLEIITKTIQNRTFSTATQSGKAITFPVSIDTSKSPATTTTTTTTAISPSKITKFPVSMETSKPITKTKTTTTTTAKSSSTIDIFNFTNCNETHQCGSNSICVDQRCRCELGSIAIREPIVPSSHNHIYTNVVTHCRVFQCETDAQCGALFANTICAYNQCHCPTSSSSGKSGFVFNRTTQYCAKSSTNPLTNLELVDSTYAFALLGLILLIAGVAVTAIKCGRRCSCMLSFNTNFENNNY